MMDHKICFSEEIWIIIPKLSLLLLLNWSPGACEKHGLSSTSASELLEAAVVSVIYFSSV